jgi:hypothetical protein
MRACRKSAQAANTASFDFFGNPFSRFLPSKPLRSRILSKPKFPRNLRASAFGFAEQALRLNGELGGRKNALIKNHLKNLSTLGQKLKWLGDFSELRTYYRAYRRSGTRGVNFENAEKVYAIAQRIINLSKPPERQVVDWKKLAANDKD